MGLILTHFYYNFPMENENAFKNIINPAVVKKTSDLFKEAYPSFNEKGFQKISAKMKELELKARVLAITEGLKIELPVNFLASAKIIKKVLAQKKLTGFELWPISEYISQFGTDHFDESLDLMYQLTQQFTSEFAIRPFLLKDPNRILKRFEAWLNDDNVHVRRWISEGTRPLLPWGTKIPSFVTKPATIHLLDALKYDEELYVRKSIANHLNDISKHHPDLVVETLKGWVKTAPKRHQDKIQWIKKQALRTLIKKGHPKALSLMGVADKTEVKISQLKLSKDKFKLGETLEFEFVLESTCAKLQKMIVDYGIGFLKSNGSISTKMFKLKTVDLAPHEKLLVKKRHSLKAITTTTFYSGEHELVLQVNGKILKKTAWQFKV
jgi:3-methyladenine DNA glycosylase AlkC